MKGRIAYKSSLVLSAAVIVFTAVEHVHLYMTEYSDGLPNDLSLWPFVLFFIYELPKLLLLIGAGLVLLVSLCCVKFHLNKNKIGIILFVCAVTTFLGYWFVRPPGAVIYLQGLKKWVEREIDTNAIQKWLLTADAKYRDKGLMISYKRNEFPEELPDYLVGFDPEFIWFEDSELDGSRTIRFGWGGSVSIWGFVVGEPGMKMPERGKVDMYGGDVEFISIVKPGVYVFFR
jgi:hypothetical protein